MMKRLIHAIFNSHDFIQPPETVCSCGKEMWWCAEYIEHLPYREDPSDCYTTRPGLVKQWFPA